MLISDMHCDLPYKISFGDGSLFGDCQWSINKLKDNNYIQFFASFIDKFSMDSPFDCADEMIKRFRCEINQTDEIQVVTKKEELLKKKVSAILTIEGGEAFGGKISNVRYFYDLGVRFVTLTWNYPNQLGEGVGEYTKNTGLKPFGIKVLKEFERLGITPDVSHLTEKGFWDVAQNFDKPFVATHSNSYKICPNKRNITDEQFNEIAKRGGLVGINLYPLFLNNSEYAELSDIMKHIEHFLSLGGEDIVCFGFDLDGVDILPTGITGINDCDKLINEMVKLNYPQNIIAKIAGKNVYNYLNSVL